MQATEVKTHLAAQPAAQAAAAEERAPAPAAQESSCCAAPARQASLRPWLIGGALLGVPLLLWGGGWDWLVAAGLSTVVLALAPCAVMCALGRCMKGGKSKEDNSLGAIRKTYETQPGEPPSQASRKG